jgi:hypothetical protein
VQVEPIKLTLKAPGTKRLQLKHDEPLSDVAFKFRFRRYSKVIPTAAEVALGDAAGAAWWQGLTLVHFSAQS